jgi:hypothetical protein
MIGEKAGLEKVEGERKEGQRLFMHYVIHTGEVRVWRKGAEGKESRKKWIMEGIDGGGVGEWSDEIRQEEWRKTM